MELEFLINMIQSIQEHKIALATYAAENDIQQLTASQLKKAREMTLVLEPVEEKETAMLPVYLKRNCYALCGDSVCPERGRQQEDNRRFAGIEDNKLLCLAILVDPNKYFVNNITRVSAKDLLEEELGAGSAEELEGNGLSSVTESRNLNK